MRKKLGILGGLALVALLVAALAGTALAQPPTPTPTKPSGPTFGPTITHDQMDRLMDAMHGEGTSQRMHEAMGPDAEKLMDQCVGMMNMMENTQGMMGSGMSGMMGSGAFGMMGGGPGSGGSFGPGITGGLSGMARGLVNMMGGPW